MVDIRAMTVDDLSEVVEMAQGLAAHHGDTATLTLETLARDALGPAPWITVLMAQSGDAVAGYAALCPLAQMQFGVRGMDMHHLFVRDAFRGQGVGTALIRASVSEAKSQNCRYLMVGTHPDNLTAQGVYAHAGFELMAEPGPRFRHKW